MSGRRRRPDTDLLGQRGEAIFTAQITKFHGQQPLFRPAFLGEKWPSADYLVELTGGSNPRGFFLVQVKTTKRKLPIGATRLRVAVDLEKLRALAAYPVPTYVVGVHEQTVQLFVISANAPRLRAVSSISSAYPLNARNRQALWKEVRDFWRGKPVTRGLSKFLDPRLV